jgi:hypothetical protein
LWEKSIIVIGCATTPFWVVQQQHSCDWLCKNTILGCATTFWGVTTPPARAILTLHLE